MRILNATFFVGEVFEICSTLVLTPSTKEIFCGGSRATNEPTSFYVFCAISASLIPAGLSGVLSLIVFEKLIIYKSVLI